MRPQIFFPLLLLLLSVAQVALLLTLPPFSIATGLLSLSLFLGSYGFWDLVSTIQHCHGDWTHGRVPSSLLGSEKGMSCTLYGGKMILEQWGSFVVGTQVGGMEVVKGMWEGMEGWVAAWEEGEAGKREGGERVFVGGGAVARGNVGDIVHGLVAMGG
ncbi:Hypothetical protein D9617_21g096370 [Elsinoe fawcettii]|nr:Hypothetical protein D9617_21g096370 [Elsinoe fawcettii]